MFVVGLTGGLATGKSTVSRMFLDLGVPIIDADLLARKVVSPGKPGWNRIRKEFGSDVLLQDGSDEIDRVKLREIIFRDSEKRRKLNQITHPEIYKEMLWAAMKHALKGHQYVVLDLPLLFEANFSKQYMHKIIVVTCEEDLQLQRLMEQRGVSESESMRMIAAQMSLEEKAEMANFVVENSGSFNDSLIQVKEIHAELKQSTLHWKIRLIVGVGIGGILGLAYFTTKRFISS